MEILFVSLLLVAVATALPVPDANLETRPPAAVGHPEEKFVPLPPCPCESCHGGEHPPFEIVGEIPGPHGHPLFVVDLNPSEEDFFEPCDEYGEEDYFSGEFDPAAIAAYCAAYPYTPECRDDFVPHPPPRVTAPGKPVIVNPALQPSGPSSGSSTTMLPISPLNPAQKPLDPLPVPLAPVDPAPLNPVIVDPLPLNPVIVDPLPLNPVDPNPLNPAPVAPLPLNPVDPTPLSPVDPVSVDPLPALNPLEPLPPNSGGQTTEIPLDEAITTAFQGLTGNAAEQTFGNFVFPTDAPLFTPADSSASGVVDRLSPNSANSENGGAVSIDKRIASQSRYTI